MSIKMLIKLFLFKSSPKSKVLRHPEKKRKELRRILEIEEDSSHKITSSKFGTPKQP